MKEYFKSDKKKREESKRKKKEEKRLKRLNKGHETPEGSAAPEIQENEITPTTEPNP